MLAGSDQVACRLLQPAYLSMINKWMPVLGNRLATLLVASASRWVNLLDFLPFYRDHKNWTQTMTRQLMRCIPRTKTDQVKKDVWMDIFQKKSTSKRVNIA